MKTVKIFFPLVLSLLLVTFYGCDKEEYFKTVSGTERELQGSWNIVPIPKYVNGVLQMESWTFSNGRLDIVRNGTPFTASYSIKTSLLSVKINVENSPEFNGSWQVVKLNSKFLNIACDRDGGLAQKEFIKRN